jgi:putative flippase GtrA
MSLPLPLENLRLRVVAAWRQGAVSLKALSFALVGLINTAVDATIFFLLLKYVTSSQTFANLVTRFITTLEPHVAEWFSAFLVENASLVVANVVAWFVAVSGSYAMNSFTTFSTETGGELRLKDYAGFVASGVVAVIATTATILVAAQYIPIWAAKAIAIGVSFVVNFTITHFVVFRPKVERELRS